MFLYSQIGTVMGSSLHKTPEIIEREDRKPAIILDYNHNKGGMDNLDKVIVTYRWMTGP